YTSSSRCHPRGGLDPVSPAGGAPAGGAPAAHGPQVPAARAQVTSARLAPDHQILPRHLDVAPAEAHPGGLPTVVERDNPVSAPNQLDLVGQWREVDAGARRDGRDHRLECALLEQSADV